MDVHGVNVCLVPQQNLRNAVAVFDRCRRHSDLNNFSMSGDSGTVKGCVAIFRSGVNVGSLLDQQLIEQETI